MRGQQRVFMQSKTCIRKAIFYKGAKSITVWAGNNCNSGKEVIRIIYMRI